MTDLKEIIGDYEAFIEKVLENIKRENLDIEPLVCDHIGYRTSSNENYDKKKEEFLANFEMADEVVIVNRPVSVYKLDEPIEFMGLTIPYLELLAPKDEAKYDDGLEHAEFVVDKDLAYFLEKYPHLQFKNKLDREINPELGINFPDGANIKLHNIPIDEVLRIQNETRNN